MEDRKVFEHLAAMAGEHRTEAMLDITRRQSFHSMPLPPGNWKEVRNSDAAAYGGSNFGNYGATLGGGNTKVKIPAAGYVVFRKQ